MQTLKSFKQKDLTIDDIKDTIDAAYHLGRANEKERWIDLVEPGTMVISFTVRDGLGPEDVNQYRVAITKEEIRMGRNSIMQFLEKSLLKIITAPIIENWIKE